MAIHHDSMLYGKLQEMSEEIDETRLSAMQQQLQTTQPSEELWDVLDADGAFVRVAKKGELSPGEYHAVAHVWTVNEQGQYLLSLRSAEKSRYPSLWETTGGAVQSDETSLQAALREAEEELGIALDPDCCTRFRRFRTDGEWVEVWVCFQTLSEKCIRLKDGETDDFQFADETEIRRMEANGVFMPFTYEEDLFTWVKEKRR